MEAKTPQLKASYRSPLRGDENLEPRTTNNTGMTSASLPTCDTTKGGKRPSMHLETCTPATAGPLKKRLKRRFSLDHPTPSTLPFTPCGFYNITPYTAFPKKDKTLATTTNTDTKLPLPLRMPFMEMSPNTASELKDAIFASSEKEHKPPGRATTPTSHLASATRNHKSQTSSPANNVSRSDLLSVSTQLVGPAKANPTAMLPHRSPILSKANNGVYHEPSERSAPSANAKRRNSYMCFIRDQLEFFELSPEDVALCKTRHVHVTIGQVALRCRHCSCISVEYRPKGSLVVANMHTSLYKHFRSGSNRHVEELCPFVPKGTQRKLEMLRLSQEEPTASFWQDFGYWSALAKSQGVVETGFFDGLRFNSSAMAASHDALGVLQPNQKHVLDPIGLCHGNAGRALSPLARDLAHPKRDYPQPKPKRRVRDPMEEPLDPLQNSIVPKKPMPAVVPLPQNNKARQRSHDEKRHPKGLTVKQSRSIDRMREAAQNLLQTAETKRAKATLHTWVQRLREFIEYKERNGHGHVPQTFPENPPLGVWVNKQRMAKKAMDAGEASNMTPAKAKLLENVGFVWEVQKCQAFWTKKYGELRTYFEKYGHYDGADRNLRRWMQTQRKHYAEYKQTGSMPHSIDNDEMDRRIRLLNEINFSWNFHGNGNPSDNEGNGAVFEGQKSGSSGQSVTARQQGRKNSARASGSSICGGVKYRLFDAEQKDQPRKPHANTGKRSAPSPGRIPATERATKILPEGDRNENIQQVKASTSAFDTHVSIKQEPDSGCTPAMGAAKSSGVVDDEKRPNNLWNGSADDILSQVKLEDPESWTFPNF